MRQSAFTTRCHPSRRNALAALLLPLALWAGVGSAQGATLEEIKKRGYLVVATEDDFRPFEFIKDGKPTGSTMKWWMP